MSKSTKIKRTLNTSIGRRGRGWFWVFGPLSRPIILSVVPSVCHWKPTKLGLHLWWRIRVISVTNSSKNLLKNRTISTKIRRFSFDFDEFRGKNPTRIAEKLEPQSFNRVGNKSRILESSSLVFMRTSKNKNGSLSGDWFEVSCPQKSSRKSVCRNLELGPMWELERDLLRKIEIEKPQEK